MSAENIPTQLKPLSKRDSINKVKPVSVPTIFYAATQDDKTGAVYLKVVNTLGKVQPVEINLKGISNVSKNATLVVISSKKAEDTNTITDPVKIVPVTTKIKGIASVFKQKLAPYSVNVYQLQTVK